MQGGGREGIGGGRGNGAGGEAVEIMDTKEEFVKGSTVEGECRGQRNIWCC